MRQIITALATSFLVSCIPPAPLNIKRDVSGPLGTSECARRAALSVPGIKGAVVNHLDKTGYSYQLLVESQLGIEYLGVSGDRPKILELSGSAAPPESSDELLNQHRTVIIALLDTIQNTCGYTLRGSAP